MIQRREELRFTLEAGEALDIRREGFRQDFERDVAIQLRIARETLRPCRLHRKQGDDFKRAELVARRKRHRHFVGTRRFNSSCQLRTTRISDVDAPAAAISSSDPLTKPTNLPSGMTSKARVNPEGLPPT